MILQTHGLIRRFGGLLVTDNVNLRLDAGARHALIGPNGAGKTTLINLLTGVLRPSAGRVHLNGEDITSLNPDRRVQRGLVRTFQINQLFPDLTPLMTIALAVTRRLGQDRQIWRRFAKNPEIIRESVALLDRFRLTGIMDRPTRTLPYGQQRLLEIAVAVACGPRVLLLDEPAAGVPENEREAIVAALAALPPETAVLLIEHDMDLVLRFATRISVLVNGKILIEGTGPEITADPGVRAVYLGT